MKQLLLSLIVSAMLISSTQLFSPALRNNSSENSSVKERFKEDPMEAYDALTFLTAMNAFPNSDIPRDGYTKAWVRHQQLLSESRSRTDQSLWKNIGPINLGGRAISIAIDPTDTSAVWLGSASGGLWKSSSGGIGANAWSYVPTGFQVLGVGGIAINPKNHNEMFIGTGEVYAYGTSTNGLVDRTQRGSYGIGILKSTDRGKTWAMSLDWTYQQNRGVWEIDYNPKKSKTLYAATTEGVYKTTDGGKTWNNSLDKKMVMDIAVDPVDTGVIYAGVGNEQSVDKGIYKTSDGGKTWTLLTNGLPAYTEDGRITLAIAPSNHTTILALIANRFNTVGYYRSTDAGQSWSFATNQEIVAYQGWYAKGLLYKSDDSQQMLTGGIDVFRSNDSGTSFTQVSDWTSRPPTLVHSDIHDIVSNPLDPDKVYILSDGGLFRSNDFGTTFFDCNSGYVSGQFYIGSSSATDPNLAIGGLQDNGTFQYNGASSWYNTNIGGDGGYNAIDPTNDSMQYGTAQYLYVTKSTDRGHSFNFVFTPFAYTGVIAFLAPLVLTPENPSVLYGGGSDIYKSLDAGLIWHKMNKTPIDSGNAILSIAVSSTNGKYIFFTTAPSDSVPMHVYKSINGGKKRINISEGLPNRYPVRIVVNPQNDQELYVVYSGFGGGHIFKSENGGTTWTDISTSLPDVPFHCLTIDPLNTNIIYAGCDFTIYGSTDGGQTWFVYANGFPDAAMVFDLVISPADRMLYAFTHGHGVYKNALLEQNAPLYAKASEPSLHAGELISAYPSPASDFVTIDCGIKVSTLVTINLYDLSGRKIKEEKVNDVAGEKISLNVSSIPSGNYLLSVTGNNFNEATKIVVMR